MSQVRLRVHPLTLKEANNLVAQWHRHHKPVTGHRFSLGCYDDWGICHGAVIVGRPVARKTPAYTVAEVTRLVTDETPNACSVLYGAAARVAKEMGFGRIQTFILESEPGTSLRAAGWICGHTTVGGSWSCSSRYRDDDHPTEPKVAWFKEFVSNKMEAA